MGQQGFERVAFVAVLSALSFTSASGGRPPGRTFAYAARLPQAPVAQRQASSARRPERIISVVPAVTEMLFAIDAGPNVIAVGSHDRYPPAVDGLTRVGALLDPDVERILSLGPDLVVVYATQTDLREQLARANISTFVYTHGTLIDVMRTIRDLGRRTGRSSEAEREAARLELQLQAVRERVGGRPAPTTLLVFGREPRVLRNIYASGGTGFLHDVLEAAGGANVFADVKRESVQATVETILARAPEVILELRYDASYSPNDMERERDVWLALPSVPAVKDGRVHEFVGDEFVVPGPRIADAAWKLARAMHPEAFPQPLIPGPR